MRISDWSSDVCSSDLVVPVSFPFMREIYGVPDSEMELLPLGADMDLIEETQARCDRDALRAELGIGPEDFVIFTGGKITPRKRTEDIIAAIDTRSEEHTSELQSLMHNPFAVFCLKQK